MQVAVAVAMIAMGAAMAVIWTRDIVSSEHVDRSKGLFAARDRDSGTLFWPHWAAEYATAIALVVGAVGLLAEVRWADVAAGIALGALLYTSTNSLGWALARRDRLPYAAPMLAGIVVGAAGTLHLLG